jgi:hypothetical protein
MQLSLIPVPRQPFPLIRSHPVHPIPLRSPSRERIRITARYTRQ